MFKAFFSRARKAFRIVTNPRFTLSNGIRGLPLVEPNCVFDFPERITVGRNVRFLRGAMVFADPRGAIVLADNTTICRYSILQSLGGQITIGENSLIGDFCNLHGQGDLTVGSDVMIASGGSDYSSPAYLCTAGHSNLHAAMPG